MFWYFVGTAVINNMLKIHDNIPHIKGVIATWVKHKCTGKIEVFITAGGGRWHSSRLSPVCPRAPVGSNQVWRLCDVGSLPRIAFPFVRPFIIGSSVDHTLEVTGFQHSQTNRWSADGIELKFCRLAHYGTQIPQTPGPDLRSFGAFVDKPLIWFSSNLVDELIMGFLRSHQLLVMFSWISAIFCPLWSVKQFMCICRLNAFWIMLKFDEELVMILPIPHLLAVMLHKIPAVSSDWSRSVCAFADKLMIRLCKNLVCKIPMWLPRPCLTVSHAPSNSCCFLASDLSNGFHAYPDADKLLVRLS